MTRRIAKRSIPIRVGKAQNLGAVTTAWYQREITIPADWGGRRITLQAEYVNSYAIAFVDGKKAGEIRFPAGEVDLTALCRPGKTYVLSLLVVAMPLKGVLLSYIDTNSAREVKGTVDRRGLCGDLYLVSTPSAARIGDVKIDTSVRKGEITLSTALDGLAADAAYTVRVEIRDGDRVVRQFTSKPFKAGDLEDGRIAVSEKWKPEKLWDVNTPQNTFTAQVSLLGPQEKVQDVGLPVRFGFREFWIDGKDFYLNGKRIYLSAEPLDSAQIGARSATYEGARETMKRLQSFGINFVYTHNYGCEPGSHVSFTDILRAADDVGMLVAFSQPHFSHYDWKAADADRTNGYARHAEFYVRAAENHPSVVAYSMSHNATGYDEDMNPDQIDGLKDPRTDSWSQNNAKLALRAEAIVKKYDPGRIVYHHSSGNLGSMHTMNFYLNFVPSQELSDWFGHWAEKGVKPVFMCEYGVPFTWDWTMYRGWYKGQREWGSALVPWEYCLAEWNAQFLGDLAFRIGEPEKKDLRWEAAQFRDGKLWHRWDYPYAVGSTVFDDPQKVLAQYTSDNWRAFRTWGVSANSPWEYESFWKLRDGLVPRRKEFKVDWDHLQKPGFSPDYAAPRQGSMAMDGEREDWIPTAAGQALLRNNRPLLAYIGGKPDHFTSKDHLFRPGETVEKQLILINNSRETMSCDCEWSLGLPQPVAGSKKLTLATGEQERIPLRFDLPAALPPAPTNSPQASASATARRRKTPSLSTSCRRRPIFPSRQDRPLRPEGRDAKLLAALNIPFQQVKANADLSSYDILIIGKEALTPDGPGPDVDRVRDGLKVVVFEQSSKVLEQRFGFRTAEYGLRQVFPRVPDSPVLAGLDMDRLRDWRGDATILPPRLQYTMRPATARRCSGAASTCRERGAAAVAATWRPF